MFYSAAAERAVDGDETVSSYYHSQASTPNPWWVLDLEAVYLVSEVVVLPRGNADHKHYIRFTDIEVGVIKTDFDVFTRPYPRTSIKLNDPTLMF